MADEAVVRIIMVGAGMDTGATPTSSASGWQSAGTAQSAAAATLATTSAAEGAERDFELRLLHEQSMAYLKSARSVEDQREAGLRELHEQAMVHLQMTKSAEENRQREIDREHKLLHEQKMSYLKMDKTVEARRDKELKLLHEQAMIHLGMTKSAEEERQRDTDRRNKALHEQAMAYLEIQKRAIPIAELAPDYTEEARKRREREIEREEIEAEYQRMYGAEERKSDLDLFLDVAKSLRGSIGGVFGPLAGTILDALALMRKAQVEVGRQKEPQPVTHTEPSLSIGDAFEAATRPAASAEVPIPEIVVPPGAASAPGGTAGAMASATGPIAIALAAKAVADAINTEVVRSIRSGVRTVGGIAEGIASANPDPSVPIGKMGDAAVAAGEKLATVIPPLGFFLTVTGEATKALSGFMQAVNQTADRYGEFSPAIAQAQAVAEIRQTLGDLRRSREVGAEMARYLIAQSDLQQKFEDTKIKLLTKLLPIATNILSILETIMSAGQGVTSAIGDVATPLTSLVSLIGAIADLMRDDRIPKGMDPTDTIRFDDMMKTPGEGRDADPGLVPRL